jgi:hypothetical protein
MVKYIDFATDVIKLQVEIHNQICNCLLDSGVVERGGVAQGG